MRVLQWKLISKIMVVSLFCAHPVFAETMGGWSRENGPLENIQVLLLLLGFICFLAPVKKSNPGFRCILLTGAMLSLSFILRELDVEDLAVPQWVILIASGTCRNIIMGTGWLVLGAFIIKCLPELKKLVKQIVLSRIGVLLAASALLLMAGSPFDHKQIVIEHGRLYEEIFEIMGYVLVLVVAVTLNSAAYRARKSP